jgi:hypothetical protein
MEQLKLDFYKHLERNPSSEILDKLNGIYACLEKYTSKIEILNFTIGPQQLASKMKYYNILVK